MVFIELFDVGLLTAYGMPDTLHNDHSGPRLGPYRCNESTPLSRQRLQQIAPILPGHGAAEQGMLEVLNTRRCPASLRTDRTSR